MAEETKVTDTQTTETQQPDTGKTPEVDYKAEYEKLLAEQKKLKEATDKACNEAANFKKALREKQTEQERAEAERAEKEAAIAAELEKYRNESRINSYKSKLIESGYDLETAAKMAVELPDGIKDEFFANQKAFIEAQKKTIEAELLNKQPGLSNGKPLNGGDIENMEMEKLRGYFGLK